MVGLGKSVLAGVIGGAAGAALWAAIAHFANAEVGWIAWLIGVLVGFCVRFAAGEQFEGFVPGAAAAVIAILSVVVGKYAAVSLAVSSVNIDEAALTMSEEEMIVTIADEFIREKESKGQKVQFPKGKTIEDA